MRSLVVVEVKEPLQGRVQLLRGGEIPAAEGDAPMLVKDRALQALDEAVRPGVVRLGARVSDPEVVTRRIETALEFTASVREDPLERPSGGLVERQQGVDEEAHGMVAGGGRDDTGNGVGTGRIARRDLPDLPDALEAADVERVETDELSRLAGLDVSSLPTSSLPLAARTLGEQSAALGAVTLEEKEPLMPRTQSDATQGPVDGARRQGTLLLRQLQGVEPGTTRGIRQRQGQNRSFVLDRQAVGTTSAPRVALGMKPISTVLHVPISPAVEQAAGDAQFPAGCRDIAELFGSS